MNNKLVRLIVFISILIPIAVAVLLFMPSKISFFGSWTYTLPHFNAIINSLTAFFITSGTPPILIKWKSFCFTKGVSHNGNQS